LRKREATIISQGKRAKNYIFLAGATFYCGIRGTEGILFCKWANSYRVAKLDRYAYHRASYSNGTCILEWGAMPSTFTKRQIYWMLLY